MMPLCLLMLLLGTPPSTTAAADTGTDITIGMKDTVGPQGPIDILKTKLPCGLSDNQRLLDTRAFQPDDPGLGSPEQHHGLLTSVPATHALNDVTPDNLLTVVDISHNSSLVLTCEGSRFRQVDGATECTPLMLENSGDMKDEDSSITQRAIHLHSPVSKQEESVPAMTETITDANLCKSDQSGFRSASCSQHTISTENDHQSIVMLQDDPIVQESASFLFEKEPTLSTLFSYQRGALQVIRGTRVRLTADSHVMLVGHGSRASDGEALLGGYRAKEVASVVGAMETVDGSLGKISVVGCELGKELAFATHLLQGLRRLGVEAILHLHRSALSVTHAGEIVTREGGDGRPVWRQGDDNNKVVVWLDGEGHLLTRMEGSQRGQVIPHYQGQALGPSFASKYFKSEGLSAPTWPNKKRFLDEKQHQNANDKCIIDLEALTWGIFGKDFTDTGRVEEPCTYFVWHDDDKELEKITVQRAIRITSLQDVVREIWYHAKRAYKPQDSKTLNPPPPLPVVSYYKLNNYLYEVNNEDIYAYLVGNCEPKENQGTFIEKHKQYIKDRHHTYEQIRKVVTKYDFGNFCDETFMKKSCGTKCAFTGHYFMAAVFAESARNFRNFPLFLMSFAGYEADEANHIDFYSEDSAPMARGGTWMFKPRRGFHGCSLADLKHKDKARNTYDVYNNSDMTKLQGMVRREIEMFECNYMILKNKGFTDLAELVKHLNTVLRPEDERAISIITSADTGTEPRTGTSCPNIPVEHMRNTRCKPHQ